MAGDDRWYFTKEQLANTPSRKNGIDADKELSYRQQAANLIQDMGQRLQVSQLCINTAIVYMHRFFMFHSMTYFHRNQMALAALFLAAKVEEQPRKLEHLIKIGHLCLHRTDVKIDINSESYLEQAQDIVCHENILLQTLGFDVAIDHPHTHVVRCCQLVKACKDLAQTSYFMASNSLHLTMMCLQYKPTVVACFCIHLACKWACWEIPQSNEGRPWYYYVDPTVTFEDLEAMTSEFLHVFDRCPSRLRKRIMSMTKNSESPSRPLINSPFDCEPRKIQPDSMLAGSSGQNSLSALPSTSRDKSDDKQKSASTNSLVAMARSSEREYREKKERERLEREKTLGLSFGHHSSSHSLHKPGIPGASGKHQSSSNNPKGGLHGHHGHQKPELNKPVQVVPPRQHNSSTSSSATSSSSSVSRDTAQRQKPRDYHMGMSASSHGLPSLDNSVESSSKHQAALHEKQRHNEYRHKQQQQVAGPQTELRKVDGEHKFLHKRKLEDKMPSGVKPREEQQKEEYLSHMLKPSHKLSYGAEKTAPVAPSQVHAAQANTHGVAKILKDTIKNGNSTSGSSSFSLNCSYEEIATSRRSEEPSLKSPPPPQPGRQRSLFSPENPPIKNEQRSMKYKQKTPPIAAKPPKREPPGFELPILDMSAPYANHQQAVPEKRPSEVLPRKPEPSVESAMDSYVKSEPEFRNEGLLRLLNGMVPKSEPQDVKSNLSELGKFDSSLGFVEPDASNVNCFKTADTILTEGESEPQIKKEEQPSPMKSAKSINALLQEAIQMPTLSNRTSLAPTTTSEVNIPTTVDLRPLSIPLVPVQTSCSSTFTPQLSSTSQNLSTSSSQDPITVAEPPAACIAGDSQSAAALLTPAVVEEKKEHHKSEKKKKEKKHKHKEKEKSKEKHKHRHKDKESRKSRDKERDKDREREKSEATAAPATAAPIKITIPKDKLNLSAELDKSSPGLKIKIPKERIKAPEGTGAGVTTLTSPPGSAGASVQAPLKIKIRTSVSSSEIATAISETAQPQPAQMPTLSVSRKRERERADESASALPAAKRPASVQQPPGGALVQPPAVGQRPSERQNGRHYGASSSNKVRGRGVARGAGQFPAGPGRPGFVGAFRREPEFRSDPATQSSYFYANYPPPPHHPPLYQHPNPGYIYDPNMYYQQFPQQYMYPTGGRVIVTPDGAIDTSVPPPQLLVPPPPRATNGLAPPRPPLPHGAPPSLTPPPPPLPQDPPPANPPLPAEDLL